MKAIIQKNYLQVKSVKFKIKLKMNGTDKEKIRLIASNFGKVCNKRENTKPENTLKEYDLSR